MTALDIWLLLAKITLFLELIEYAIVLQIRFTNTTLSYHLKRGKRTKPNIVADRVKSKNEVDELITAKCKRIDSQAFLGFLLGSIFINFVYFIYYW